MPVVMPRKKYGETSFGQRLVLLRKARGFTQVQLARAANTTQRAISYYETEAGFPPAPAVVQLARALRITTDELLGVRTPKIDHLDDDAESRRLWRRFRQIASLPDRDQRAVIRLINSLSAGRSEARA
jgi:transcriptional regulator with XRE-family HTH domain